MALSVLPKTKIVTTLGPSTVDKVMLEALVDAGVDVFRLNMGHMDHGSAADAIAHIRRISQRVSILLDLQGPKIRLTRIDTPFNISAGDEIEISAGEEDSLPGHLHIPFAELIAALLPGHRLLIDDGLLRLKVTERRGPHHVLTEVITGGTVKGRKGVAAPDTCLTPDEYLDAQDRADCDFAVRKHVDFVAASFVSRAEDIMTIRDALGSDGHHIHVIAKIESRVGVENFESILQAADGIMVARGDLGVELPAEEVPLIQKHLIKRCNAAAKPVIVATQMLESMVNSPVASRAETSDVANAILDGTDAVMLSAETSVGKYPLQAVQTLRRICEYVEREASLFRLELYNRGSTDRVGFICKSAARMAEELKLNAIVSLTSSGFTARHMSAFRPKVVVLATTPNSYVSRHLTLQYGVHCIQAEHEGRYDVVLYNSLKALVEKEFLVPDDVVGVIGGVPMGKPGTTNMLQVGTVAELMAMD